MTVWTAFFCPHCGYTLNEHELETYTEPQARLKPKPGSSYTCGWCHKRQNDWGHVKRCRVLHQLMEDIEEELAEKNTIKLFRELSTSATLTGIEPNGTEDAE